MNTLFLPLLFLNFVHKEGTVAKGKKMKYYNGRVGE